MICRISKGVSFRAAGLYYLHDKDAWTSERVLFTETLNMRTLDPEKAFKVMAWTALHQGELKQASGIRSTGRKTKYPVYAVSLSWAQDEYPSREEMIQAARDILKQLGMEEHETVLVAHGDTDHPHIHVIVNRIHPVTGKVAGISNDRIRLSKWAERYEKEHGEVLCRQRANNNAERARGKWVKYKKQQSSQMRFHHMPDPNHGSAYLGLFAKVRCLSVGASNGIEYRADVRPSIPGRFFAP